MPMWPEPREFVEGKTLQQLMEENPDKLKEKTIRALKSEEQLDENLRYELLTRLDGMPKHTKLCHGDFCPSNIIVGDDGKWYLVDWVHASQGNASADVART